MPGSCFDVDSLPCRPGQSQLFTSTMLWKASGLSSLEDYLDSSLGIQKSLFPTVLGLKLAEDLDLGRRFEPWDHTNINVLIPRVFPPGGESHME